MPSPPTNSITIYYFAENLAPATFLRSDPNLDGPAPTMRRNVTCATWPLSLYNEKNIVFQSRLKFSHSPMSEIKSSEQCTWRNYRANFTLEQGHEGTQGNLMRSSTLSFSSVDGMSDQGHTPANLPLGKTQYPLYRKLVRPRAGPDGCGK
jgi:hypothetical protein